MFTGLIEEVGRIAEVSPRRGSTRIGIVAGLGGERPNVGDSVAVNGACLTVAERRPDGFRAEVVAETLARTTLGRARPGDPVNLERALRLGDRLDGHLVQGHVDGTAAVQSIRRRGDDHRVRLALAPGFRKFVAAKGSIALHGVSLTVAALGATWFEVALVPQTLERTTLGRLRVGESLNMEVDLLSRYLDSLVGAPRAD